MHGIFEACKKASVAGAGEKNNSKSVQRYGQGLILIESCST